MTIETVIKHHFTPEEINSFELARDCMLFMMDFLDHNEGLEPEVDYDDLNDGVNAIEKILNKYCK